jgi:hypothetical protein
MCCRLRPARNKSKLLFSSTYSIRSRRTQSIHRKIGAGLAEMNAITQESGTPSDPVKIGGRATPVVLQPHEQVSVEAQLRG